MFLFKRFIILFIAIVAVAIIVFLILALRPNSPLVVPHATENKVPSIVSTASSEPTTEMSEVHSPDGKMNLIMEKITESGVSTYSFFASEIPETSRTLIFKKTLSAGSMMQMSPNAWSPDNKYFFIKEASGNSVDFFVFNASGEPFSDGAGNMDVMSIFNTKQTGYNLADVTGWDSQTLLHVFTTTKEGTSGPSYWFEVPSGAVIQLASPG